VLKAAVESLLSLKMQYYGQSGLYNALYQSELRLDGVNIKDGVAIINLSGSLQIGGECDSPRVEAQIQQTALQFTTVKDVSVRINGRTLQDVLSLK
jgi:spore germination protein GerM